MEKLVLRCDSLESVGMTMTRDSGKFGMCLVVELAGVRDDDLNTKDVAMCIDYKTLVQGDDTEIANVLTTESMIEELERRGFDTCRLHP